MFIVWSTTLTHAVKIRTIFLLLMWTFTVDKVRIWPFPPVIAVE